MKKNTKKIIVITGVGLTMAASIYLFGKNRKLSGIIKNQQLMIDGLTKEVKKLAYHLGKKS